MTGRVTLKLATSLDGRIATASGQSKWITGEAARQETHHLRSRHDAVVIGIETALADDPALTVRLDGYEGPQPARVVLDSRQRLPVTSALARTANRIPTYVVAASRARPHLEAAGVVVLEVPEGRDYIQPVVDALAERDLHRLMIEGGGVVAGAFLDADLVDAIEWFRAPIILGADGRPAIGALAVQMLGDAPRFRRVEVSSIGDDLWERYEKV